MRGIPRAAGRDPSNTHHGAFNANASLQIVAARFAAAWKSQACKLPTYGRAPFPITFIRD
jgi:hypothetical protein